jgi:hypothetical protein
LDRFDPPSQEAATTGVDGEDAVIKQARDKQLLPWAEMPYNRGTLKNGVGSDDPIWCDRGNWTFSGTWHICRTGLTMNIVTALVLVISLATGNEVWSRRRWRYSLRSLLAAILVFAVVLAWWRTAVNGVEEELRAAEALQDKGFAVTLECNAPVLLQILVGTNRLRPFMHVCEILYDASKPPGVPVTDADMECIGVFPRLQFLSLSDTQITSKGLEDIRALPVLEVLYLDNTMITDPGLESVHDLPSLRFLSLENTKVTGEGFQFLRNLPRLEDLSLDGSPITDDSLSRLAILPQVRFLSLCRTKITDAGLQHLEDTRIKKLYLDGTKVSDVGLKCLEKCPELEDVSLEETKATAEGVEGLKRALPKYWDHSIRR